MMPSQIRSNHSGEVLPNLASATKSSHKASLVSRPVNQNAYLPAYLQTSPSKPGSPNSRKWWTSYNEPEEIAQPSSPSGRPARHATVHLALRNTENSCVSAPSSPRGSPPKAETRFQPSKLRRGSLDSAPIQPPPTFQNRRGSLDSQSNVHQSALPAIQNLRASFDSQTNGHRSPNSPTMSSPSSPASQPHSWGKKKSTRQPTDVGYISSARRNGNAPILQRNSNHGSQNSLASLDQSSDADINGDLNINDDEDDNATDDDIRMKANPVSSVQTSSLFSTSSSPNIRSWANDQDSHSGHSTPTAAKNGSPSFASNAVLKHRASPPIEIDGCHSLSPSRPLSQGMASPRRKQNIRRCNSQDGLDTIASPKSRLANESKVDNSSRSPVNFRRGSLDSQRTANTDTDLQSHQFKSKSRLGKKTGEEAHGLDLHRQKLKRFSEDYNTLVTLSENDLQTVTMAVLEMMLLPGCSKQFADRLMHLRERVNDPDNISFERFLELYFPNASMDEIERMASEAHPHKSSEKPTLQNEEVLDDDFDRMWALWDSDGSGELNKFEFQQAMKSIGILDRDDFDRLHEQVDTTGNGTIDKAEFRAWWKTHGDFTFE